LPRPVILATQEAEIMRIAVQIQPRKIFPRPYLEKKSITKKRAVGVVQGIGPKFKSQYRKKREIFDEAVKISLISSRNLCIHISNILCAAMECINCYLPHTNSTVMMVVSRESTLHNGLSYDLN
jgi:hypothetical protein